MTGHPITGIRVNIEDGKFIFLSRSQKSCWVFKKEQIYQISPLGSYHEVDSSDFSFNRAGYFMMLESIPKAGVVLEPYMELEVTLQISAQILNTF